MMDRDRDMDKTTLEKQADNIQEDYLLDEDGSDSGNFSNQACSSHAEPELKLPILPYNKHEPEIGNPDNFGKGKHANSYLCNLVENVNSMYQKKLLEAEKFSLGGRGDEGADRVCVAERKINIMHEWVQDLNEQNSILIETVEEMEDEAEGKVQLLQSKVQRSTQMLMEHMKIIQEYEKQVQTLFTQREEGDKQYDMLHAEAIALEKKRKKLQEKLERVETDNQMLITLITRIRDWGVWDITGLKFEPETYYHLFDLYPKLPGSEVQTVFTQERAKEVKQTEEKFSALKNDYSSLENYKNEIENQIKDKTEHTQHLENELSRLQIQMSEQKTENCELRRALEDTQTLLSNTLKSNQVTAKADENELLKELRELKGELQVACTERQNAMLEANSLKAEMNQRLAEMNQMKNLLMNIQAETENTRGKVEDVEIKQSELSTLKDEVERYQQKYDEARSLLTNKSQMIHSLQKQMDMLHEKMTSIELNKHFQSSSQKIPSHVIHSPSIPPSKRHSKTTIRTSNEIVRAAEAMASERFHKHIEGKSGIGSTIKAEFEHKPPWNENFTKTSVSNTTIKDLGSNYSSKHMKQKELLPISVRYPKRNKVLGNNTRSTTLSQSATFNNQRSKSVEKPSSGFTEKQEVSPKLATDFLIRTDSKKNINENSSTFLAAKHEKIANYFQNRFGLRLENIESRGTSKQSEPCKMENLNDHKEESVKLPLIPDIEIKSSKFEPEIENSYGSSDYQKLPPLVEVEKGCEQEENKESGKEKQISADPYELKTLEALVTAAVQTSKKLISSFDPKQGNMEMKVKLSHRKLRAIHEASRKFADGDGYQHQANISPGLVLDKHYQEQKQPDNTPQTINQENESKLEHEKNKCLVTSREDKKKCTEKVGRRMDPEEILKKLPVQDQDVIVKNWIMDNDKGQGGKATNVVSKISSEKLDGFSKSGIISSKGSNCSMKKGLYKVSNPVGAPYRDPGHAKTNIIFQGLSKEKQMKREDRKRNLVNMEKEIRVWLNDNFECSEAESSDAAPRDKILGFNHNNNVLGDTSQILDSEFQTLSSLLSKLRLEKDAELHFLQSELEVEKKYRSNLDNLMTSKDVEIAMQKITIQHLQDMVLAVKRQLENK